MCCEGPPASAARARAMHEGGVHMPAQSKYEMLEKVNTSLDASQGLFVVDYRGLTVKETQEFRRSLREVGANMNRRDPGRHLRLYLLRERLRRCRQGHQGGCPEAQEDRGPGRNRRRQGAQRGGGQGLRRPAEPQPAPGHDRRRHQRRRSRSRRQHQRDPRGSRPFYQRHPRAAGRCVMDHAAPCRAPWGAPASRSHTRIHARPAWERKEQNNG